MYRFLLTPRWIGLALVMALAATVMVFLGIWQLHRYHEHADYNARVDAAAAPVTVTSASDAPPAEWLWVSVTGTYDPTHEIVARARPNSGGAIGFEIIDPLVLADGSAVLVDRGWLAPGDGGATQPPTVPAAPTGPVTVVGRVHYAESGSTAVADLAGRPSVRRISPATLASSVPYVLYGAYVNLETQSPAADPAFVAIEPDHANAAMNEGYVVQWICFALLTLAGYVRLAVVEARSRRAPSADAEEPAPALS